MKFRKKPVVTENKKKEPIMMDDKARKILDDLYTWATEPNGIHNLEHRDGYNHAQFDAKYMIDALKQAVDKPVVIEAFKWTCDQHYTEEPGWIIEALKDGTVVIPNLSWSIETYGRFVMEINTLEGVMIADQGDYIIQGIKGEIYPIKEEIFYETYEEVK